MKKYRLNIPNRISLSRIFLSFALFVLMLVSLYLKPQTFYIIPTTHFTILDLVCFVVFILLASTDSIDGHIARSRNMVSDLGKVLDPIADKLLVDGSLIILSVKSPMLLPPLFVVLLIARDLIIDGVRIMASSKGKVIPANIWGKLKTVFEMILIPVVIIRGFPFNYIDWYLNNGTLGQPVAPYKGYDFWLNGKTFEFIGETSAMGFALTLGLITVILSLLSGAIYIYRAKDYLVDNSINKGEKK